MTVPVRQRIEAALARSAERAAARERSRLIRARKSGHDCETSTAKPEAPRPLKIERRDPEVEQLIRNIEKKAAARLGGKFTPRERRALYLLRTEKLEQFMEEFGDSTWWDRPETKWGVSA